jgi:hypothetical protein
VHASIINVDYEYVPQALVSFKTYMPQGRGGGIAPFRLIILISSQTIFALPH